MDRKDALTIVSQAVLNVTAEPDIHPDVPEGAEHVEPQRSFDPAVGQNEWRRKMVHIDVPQPVRSQFLQIEQLIDSDLDWSELQIVAGTRLGDIYGVSRVSLLDTEKKLWEEIEKTAQESYPDLRLDGGDTTDYPRPRPRPRLTPQTTFGEMADQLLRSDTKQDAELPDTTPRNRNMAV